MNKFKFFIGTVFLAIFISLFIIDLQLPSSYFFKYNPTLVLFIGFVFLFNFVLTGYENLKQLDFIFSIILTSLIILGFYSLSYYSRHYFINIIHDTIVKDIKYEHKDDPKFSKSDVLLKFNDLSIKNKSEAISYYNKNIEYFKKIPNDNLKDLDNLFFSKSEDVKVKLAEYYSDQYISYGEFIEIRNIQYQFDLNQLFIKNNN